MTGKCRKKKNNQKSTSRYLICDFFQLHKKLKCHKEDQKGNSSRNFQIYVNDIPILRHKIEFIVDLINAGEVETKSKLNTVIIIFKFLIFFGPFSCCCWLFRRRACLIRILLKLIAFLSSHLFFLFQYFLYLSLVLGY